MKPPPTPTPALRQNLDVFFENSQAKNMVRQNCNEKGLHSLHVLVIYGLAKQKLISIQ